MEAHEADDGLGVDAVWGVVFSTFVAAVWPHRFRENGFFPTPKLTVLYHTPSMPSKP